MLQPEPNPTILISGASATEMMLLHTWFPEYHLQTEAGKAKPILKLAFGSDASGIRQLQVTIDTHKDPAEQYTLPIQAFNGAILKLLLQLLIRAKEDTENNSYYAYGFQHALDVILVADCDHRILNANPAAIQKFGYSKEALLQMDIRTLFLHERDSRDLLKNICGDDEYKKDYVLVTKDETPFPASVAAFTMNEEEGLFLVVIRDISRKKDLEAIKAKQDQLTTTGKMARIIAHELRNPLHNILLASQLLEEESNNKVNEERLIIQRNCQRIDDLIRQLLEPGQWHQLDTTRVSVHELIQQVCTLVQDRLALKQVSIKTNIAPDLYLQADAPKLETALVNLVVNAIEAIDAPTGHITIEAGYRSDKAFISISDNGRGMSPEEQQQLFSPYYTTKPHGLGLGLVNTQQIVEAHGGKLQLGSRERQGTVFTILLPEQDGQAG